jgi:sugar phosphate isomerase/epimerase
MKRRDLLRGAAGALAACAAPVGFLVSSAARAQRCTNRTAGVQLFTVRDPLQRDARGTLAALRDIGIEEAEAYGLDAIGATGLFGLPLAELRKTLGELGIRVPTAHIGGALTSNEAAARAANALGIETLIVALPSEFSGPSGMVGARSIEQLDRLADRLTAAARELRTHGLRFGYHNHHVEFLDVDGEVPFEYLMANTDRELVQIELDIGWLAVAGVDPHEYLRRYRGRVLACHLKDYAPERGRAPDGSAVPLQRQLVEPGAGMLDWQALLETMSATGVRHGYVEVDETDDPLGAVERGHAHLTSLRC